MLRYVYQVDVHFVRQERLLSRDDSAEACRPDSAATTITLVLISIQIDIQYCAHVHTCSQAGRSPLTAHHSFDSSVLALE